MKSTFLSALMGLFLRDNPGTAGAMAAAKFAKQIKPKNPDDPRVAAAQDKRARRNARNLVLWARGAYGNDFAKAAA